MAMPQNEFENISFNAHRFLTEKVVQLREQDQTGVNPLMIQFLLRLVDDYITDRIQIVPEDQELVSKSRLTQDRLLV